MNSQSVCLTALIPWILVFSGCASQAPTIAHTHIGHAMDGWHDTPDQEGLLVTAEQSAEEAVQSARAALAPNSDLQGIKYHIAEAVEKTDPVDDASTSSKASYGVKNGVAEASAHIIFASNSRDASDNVRKSAREIRAASEYIINRCDLIAALGEEVHNSTSAEEARILSQEILKLVIANRDGNDSNGDGVIGSAQEEYGLKQLRNEIQAMINREDPPYSTVDSWYLFNLVKLPSGEWVFRKLGIAGDSQSSNY